MIKDITELNFPEYATLSQATLSMQNMGEKSVSAQVRIDGGIAPDFSYDWEIEVEGERYIHPLRQPQAAKGNTSSYSTIDLTFQHWAVYQLKRYYFVTMQPIDSGTAVADKYIASVSLNLADFCGLFGQVLRYYFGDTITIDLNEEWAAKSAKEPTTVEISYSYLWDVLIQLYDLYAVSWRIDPNGDTGHYAIKVGYPSGEIGHIFGYGFDGGMLTVERQVQSDDIRNMLLGRGGERNLPYRYFKDVDPQNPSFPADPDWIPELRNIYFSELHGKTFRDYVKGWKTNPNRQLTETDGAPITPYGSSVPIAVGTYDSAYAAESWAYKLGHEDERFNPVEYVKDDKSISLYGVLMGGLENNDEIYPSIQGVSIDGTGRVDEVIEVEPVLSDDVEEAADNRTYVSDIDPCKGSGKLPARATGKLVIASNQVIEVPEGMVADLSVSGVTVEVLYMDHSHSIANGYKAGLVSATPDMYEYGDPEVKVFDFYSPGEALPPTGIPAGRYTFKVYVEFRSKVDDHLLLCTASFSEGRLTTSSQEEHWGSIWHIWVKNIWGTAKRTRESAGEYADRVWGPILGDRTGEEAKVVFSSGFLSTSEDYEFTIAGTPVYEQKECKWTDGDNIEHSYTSEWCIPLLKSDADLESTGLYLPSTMRQAHAGDHFFFIGIDMPHQYVLWAEERLDGYKTDALRDVCDIKPEWVVSPDKLRVARLHGNEAQTLMSQIKPGVAIHLADSRFILNGQGTEEAYETLYIQSVTYTYNEPSDDSPALIPDIEMVLSDRYETVANPVSQLQGEVSALSRQVGALSGIEQVVRAVGDKLYLRKDGIDDRSMSQTQFFSLLTSGGFRNGMIGGSGWGFFKDANGNWVLETDRINVRQGMQVNELVINQVTARGGMIIESAASMEITAVYETESGYECYFDQKGGTVANLFHVDDVAMAMEFDRDWDGSPLRSYRRRVTAVSESSVTLTKGYSPVELADGTADTGVNGDGIPQVGDVIVHYGSYTDSERRYVKVRDVVGGGYERYIEGLDSVNAAGTEYYFVGRQAGMYGGRPRWYIGDSKNYIEYLKGELNIKARLNMLSPVGDGDNTLGDIVSAVGDSITDTDIWYIQTELGSEAPATPDITDGEVSDAKGWSTSAPQHVAGMQVWSATFVRKGNGVAYFTVPVNISANDGTPAKIVKIQGQQVFSYSDGFSTLVGPERITLTATLQGTEGYCWQHKAEGKSEFTDFIPSDNSTISFTPDNPTLFPGTARSVLIRCTSGGTYDEVTVLKVSSGSDGIDGTDAYTVLLTNESHTFEGDTDHAVAATATCGVVAYKGSEQAAVTIGAITGMPTGMQVVATGNGTTSAGFSVSVTTALTTIHGTLNVPVTVDGITFNKTFSWALARKGAMGEAVTLDGTSVRYSSEVDSAEQPPDDTFTLASVPELKAGQYLWAVTIVTYSDGDSTRTYSVSRQGTDGTSVTVESTSVTYQASTSGTTPPTGTWSTTIPDVAEGQWLWTRTTVTYSDGTPVTTYSVSRQGVDGADGDSITIVSTEVRYAKGNYPSQPSDSAFTLTSVGTLTKGQWLWTRTTVTYSDGTPAKSYTAAYIGSDGSDGTPGANGVDGKTTYVHFAYASAVTGSLPHPTSVDGFSTTAFIGAKYIGICTDYNSSDPTEDVGEAYEWSEYRGEDGTSVTVESTVTHYVQTTGSAQPNETVFDSGGTSVPSPLHTGRYLWTRTTVTYSDETVSKTYSVSRIGSDGSDGTPGANGYVHIAYGDSITGSLPHPTSVDGFSTTAKTTSRYIGFRADNNSSDPTEDVGEAYEWSKYVGADGLGISRIVEEYYLSTSRDTPTGGSWSTTRPTWVSGTYIWTRSHIYYTNGNNVTIGEVCATGADGTSPYRLDITNEVAGVACDAAGNPTGTLPSSQATVYSGGAVDSGWSLSATGTGCTVSTVTTAGRFSVLSLTSDTATVEITATKSGQPTLKAVMSIYKVRPGADGADAVVYSVEAVAGCITLGADGNLTPSSMTATKYRTAGGTARAATTEKMLWVSFEVDGVETGGRTLIAVGAGPSATISNINSYVPSGTTAVLLTLYDTASTSSTVLDRERIPVITDASGLEIGGTNLLTGTNQGAKGWTANGSTDGAMTIAGELMGDVRGLMAENGSSIESPQWQILMYGIPYDLFEAGEHYMLSFDASSDVAGVTLYVAPQLATGGTWLTTTRPTVALQTSMTRHVLSLTGRGAGASDKKYYLCFTVTPGIHWETIRICNLKLERGNLATSWSPSPRDIDYITQSLVDARNENGSFEGGLILASLMRMGYTADDGEYRVMSGVNGNASSRRNPALWAGGEPLDAAEEENASNPDHATFMVRHDGTAYACDNTVRFEANRIEVGDNVVLDSEGLKLVGTDGTNRLVVHNGSVGTDFPAIQTAVQISGTDTSAAIQLATSPTLSPSTGFEPRQTLFILNGFSKTYSIGTAELTKGSQFTAKVTAEFSVALTTNSDGVVTMDANLSPLTVELLCAGTVVWKGTGGWTSAKVGNSSTYRFTAVANVNTAIGTAGVHTMRVSLAANGEFGTAYASPSVSVSRSGKVALGYESQTILGNDGLLSVWNGAAMLVRGNYWGALVGNYGFAIKSDGFYKTSNGGSTWTRLTL